MFYASFICFFFLSIPPFSSCNFPHIFLLGTDLILSEKKCFPQWPSALFTCCRLFSLWWRRGLPSSMGRPAPQRRGRGRAPAPTAARVSCKVAQLGWVLVSLWFHQGCHSLRTYKCLDRTHGSVSASYRSRRSLPGHSSAWQPTPSIGQTAKKKRERWRDGLLFLTNHFFLSFFSFFTCQCIC